MHPEKCVAMGVETEKVFSNFYKIDENKLKIAKSENDLWCLMTSSGVRSTYIVKRGKQTRMPVCYAGLLLASRKICLNNSLQQLLDLKYEAPIWYHHSKEEIILIRNVQGMAANREFPIYHTKTG